MSQEQLEVIEELEREIDLCTDAVELAELERTLSVCRELIYGIAEGIIECEEDEQGELMFFSTEVVA